MLILFYLLATVLDGGCVISQGPGGKVTWRAITDHEGHVVCLILGIISLLNFIPMHITHISWALT